MFPWLWFCWIVDRDNQIPLIRFISKSTVRHLEKASDGAIPYLSTVRHLEKTSDGAIPYLSLDQYTVNCSRLGCRSILPTYLAYIVPLTRGYSPWRPDVVMSTIGHG
ncbi:hypothetical protein Gogos_019054 [Gossypium gossypioides]|uniref:Uncharacterized protein n=1 Tax=Gossypium gossypioides TaxID=34282 RepID=A0A7J9BG87_GOSGO|nr:hypothetical protein [Gossypium gossypioides]